MSENKTLEAIFLSSLSIGILMFVVIIVKNDFSLRNLSTRYPIVSMFAFTLTVMGTGLIPALFQSSKTGQNDLDKWKEKNSIV